MVERLQHHFREALGRSHDIGRIHGLVGRYQHEGLDLGLVRGFRRVPGRDHVVVDALDDVLLDDRHMLVRARVIHRLDAVGQENLAHPLLVMSIADEPDELDLQRILLGDGAQFALDVVERELRHFEQHQPLRAQPDDLTAQLRADRAPRTRDHHDPVANAGLEERRLGGHRIASQKVAHVDLADVVHVRVPGDQLLELRDRLYMHAQRLERAQYFAPPAPGQRRHRQQDAVDIAVLDERGQLFRRKYLDAVHHATVQASVVIDEYQRIERARGREHGGQPRAGITCAVDGYPRHGRLNVAGEQVIPDHEA